MAHVRRWSPVPAIVVTSILVQKLAFESRYDVGGHAGEHLASASAPFMAVGVVAVLLYVTPPARRQPIVLLTAGAWIVATAFILVGNVRVIDALAAAGMSHVPTGQLEATPAIEAAHALANSAPMYAVLATVALAVALRLHRHISTKVAVGAVVLSLLFPPWIIPGAGVFVLVVARCMAFGSRVTDVPLATEGERGYRQ
ncbi:MAG TPA: hypothetical protein VM030_08540 [Acidimicrobiales bacterium]|nr:hypothetical protein [Acidimicrobiales bacterium]